MTTTRRGETLYYLQLRRRDPLRAGRPLPDGVAVAAEPDPRVVREVTLRVGAPYGWPSQHWEEPRWAWYLARTDLRHWALRGGGEVLGLASLRLGDDEVEVDTFGLVPEHVGRGLGGPFLAEVIAVAWELAPGADRVWLHTSSADHPHALHNYLSRGFRLYRTLPPPD